MTILINLYFTSLSIALLTHLREGIIHIHIQADVPCLDVVYRVYSKSDKGFLKFSQGVLSLVV